MPYNKTVVLNEQQDEFLQSVLQPFRNENWMRLEESQSAVAVQILELIETAAETNVT